jgi:hypothetical protein
VFQARGIFCDIGPGYDPEHEHETDYEQSGGGCVHVSAAKNPQHQRDTDKHTQSDFMRAQTTQLIELFRRPLRHLGTFLDFRRIEPVGDQGNGQQQQNACRRGCDEPGSPFEFNVGCLLD